MAIQYPSNNIHGAPGERWVNETDKTWWQLKVSFINSCGQCVQYANTLARFWPVPFHPGCNCRSVPVTPGQRAEPFLDFREEIRQLPESQQSSIMGAANYELVQKGVVQWEDVVGRSGIKPFWQVVQKHRLSVDTLTKAGIPRSQAEQTLARLNSPEQLALQQKHKAIYDQLLAAGLTPEQIRDEMTKRLAARFGLVGKPNPPGSPLVVVKPTGGGGSPGAGPQGGGPGPKPAPRPKPGPSQPATPSPVRLGENPLPITVGPTPKNVPVNITEKCLEGARKLFRNPALTPHDLACMAGAPPGSEEVNVSGGHEGISVSVEHAELEGLTARFQRDKKNHEKLEMRLVSILKREELKKKDVGLAILARQVEFLSKHGGSRIELLAAGSHRNLAAGHQKAIGYLIWAKYGFNGELSPGSLKDLKNSDLPEDAKRSRTIHELMTHSAEARTWWEHHGDEWDGTFDLAPNSRHLQIFGDYLLKRVAGGTLKPFKEEQ